MLIRPSSSLPLFLLCCFTLPASAAQKPAAKIDASQWKVVEQAMGRPGQEQNDGALRFAMPRKDLHVTVAGIEIKPGFALGSWVAFDHPGEGAMLMGDLVLTEDEVPKVMQKLEAGGVNVNALHNHLLNETPHVMYMHIGGEGDAVKLAQALRAAIAETGTPAASASAAAPAAQNIDLDEKQLVGIIGRTGKQNGGIFQFSIPRAEHVTVGGKSIPNSLGLGTTLNFEPTGGGKAAITGDFVLLSKEVNPVIHALIQNGIAVTALHGHMLGDKPRLFFMHFWAVDDAAKLARGLRAALDKTNSAPAQ